MPSSLAVVCLLWRRASWKLFFKGYPFINKQKSLKQVIWLFLTLKGKLYAHMFSKYIFICYKTQIVFSPIFVILFLGKWEITLMGISSTSLPFPRIKPSYRTHSYLCLHLNSFLMVSVLSALLYSIPNHISPHTLLQCITAQACS